MKVLITGGTRPLGLAVAQELKAGHQIYLLDTEPAEKLVGRVSKLDGFSSIYESRPTYEFIRCNILNLDSIQQAVKGMDAIIHLAELPDDVSIDVEEREQQELDFATRGTYYLMRAAASEGINGCYHKLRGDSE